MSSHSKKPFELAERIPLRLAEIIGEDQIIDIGSETLYFIISTLNQLNIDRIRNKILLQVLPLKV